MRVVEAINILDVSTPEPAEINQAYEAYVSRAFPQGARVDLRQLGEDARAALEDRFDYVQEHWEELREELNGYAAQRKGETPESGEEDQTAQGLDLVALYQERYEAVAKMDGVVLELCGTWLWCSGNTRPHAADLKQYGFRWARKKLMWSWHPPTYKRRGGRREWGIEEIRGQYGSQRDEDRRE